MSARQADAATVCKSVLASGSRNVDVYWKLSSAQYQGGQQTQANKTLDDALSLHPGNSRLTSLREIIKAATTEQALIIRSSKVNQSSLDKGAVKIACLTKSGTEAILACRQRLELTDEDEDRIRARLARLESQQAPTIVATKPKPKLEPEPIPTKAPIAPVVTATIQPIQTPVKAITAAPEPTAEQLALAERRKAYKALVAQVQTALNGFGFNVGSPDGVSGGKTRKALTDFYTAISAPVVTAISDATLENLARERNKLNSARQLLRQSEQSIGQGNSQLAGQLLANAKSTSRLLKVPAQHEQALRTAQNTTLPLTTATATQASKTAKQQTAPQNPTGVNQPKLVPIATAAQAPETAQNPSVTQTIADTQNGAIGTNQFAQLMNQINTLQGQIRRKQADQAQQLDRIRNVF